MSRMRIGLALLSLHAACPAQEPRDLGPFTQLTAVGDVTRQSLVTYDRSSGIYFLSAAGGGLGGERDSFAFVWKEMKSDVAIAARVRIMGSSEFSRRHAGVMLRQSAAADAAHVSALVDGEGRLWLRFRAQPGGETRAIRCASEQPAALRLEQRGAYVQLFVANEDGVFAATGCQARVPLRGRLLAGLAVAAGDDGGFENARFSSVTVGAPPPRRAVRIAAIELVTLDPLERRILWYSSAPLEVPSFTARGDAICFREGGELRKLSLAGRAEPVAVAADNIAECATAAPAGVRLAQRLSGARARVWLEPADGQPQPLTSASRNAWLPRLAPDAASFVYLAGGRADGGRPAPADYLLTQQSLADGGERVLAQFHGGAGSLGLAPWSADGRQLEFVSREAGPED